MVPSQQALLRLLQTQTEPASLSMLKKHLSIPDRTLRRWLAQLVRAGSIKPIGEGKGRKYDLLPPEEKAILFKDAETVT